MREDKLKEAMEMIQNSTDKEELQKRIEEIGRESLGEKDLNRIKEMVEKYKKEYVNKEDDELLKEIEKLKETTDVNKIKKTLLKNRKAIKQLYSMMDEKQKKRLEKILEALKDNK